MFEKEIKFSTDFSLNQVKNLGSFFTIDKLLSTDLHPAIRKYVSAEMDYLLYSDREKLLQNSLFDYSGSEISKHFDLIGEEIKKTKRVSYEDMKKLIIQSISFNANFVARPKWSLSKLVFGDKESVSVKELKMIFNYLYYYDYLKNIFTAYLAKRKLTTISLTEFELIQNKIDRELFSTQSEKLIENALISINDFYNIGGVENPNVPLEAVETFLKEKNLMDHLMRLHKTASYSSKKNFNIDDMRKILFTPLPKAADTEKLQVNDEEKEDNQVAEEIIEYETVEEQETTSDVKNEEQNDSSEDKEIVVEDEGEVEQENEPVDEITKEEDELLKVYDKELQSIEEEIELSDEKDKLDEGSEIDSLLTNDDLLDEVKDKLDDPATDEIIIEEEIKIEEEDVLKADDQENLFDSDDKPDEASPTRERDLFSFLSDKETERIIEGIFNSDNDDFATTIEKITECSNYDEATNILKSVFTSYKIGPYSKDAVTLTGAVAEYFSQED